MLLGMRTQKLPTFQDYEVLEKIADGSMSTVYRARGRADNQLVALKVPSREVENNPVLLQRLQEEFRVGSTLRHPGFVRALALGQEGTTCYLVLELVDGPDLWRRLEQSGPLPEAEAVGIIVQIATALHEAHRQGILHRDVKPDNILLGPDGQAKLCDFGLLKDLDGELDLTRTHRGLGTPNFIAPEQFGDARHAGVACDVYSLGATLYMAVTGELPFESRSLAATLTKKINNEIQPPCEAVPSLSERVDWAIRRALQAKPEKRYASCQEFIQALTVGGEQAGPVIDAASGSSRRGSTERRKWRRWPCTLATVCEVAPCIHDGSEEAPDSWEGVVRNLSARGIGILLPRRFEPGTLVTVVLQTPSGSFRRSLGLRIRRVVRTPDGRWFVGGMFSTELSRDEVRCLV
jgi:serine/threonine protein kinase